MPTPRLLLVDSDSVLCQVLSDYLQSEGFRVLVAQDGESGLSILQESGCDLVLLDTLLTDMNGLEVLRQIRQQGEIPVMMLTAKNESIECIVGLELGADDYLSKSCNPRELVARLRAILRRTRRALNSAETQSEIGAGLHLSTLKRTAIWRGQTLTLTSTEFDLLHTLLARAGHPVSKEDLAMHALKREIGRYDRSLDMHVSNLRKKLGKLADGRSPIRTINGSGYQWTMEQEASAKT